MGRKSPARHQKISGDESPQDANPAQEQYRGVTKAALHLAPLELVTHRHFYDLMDDLLKNQLSNHAIELQALPRAQALPG